MEKEKVKEYLKESNESWRSLIDLKKSTALYTLFSLKKLLLKAYKKNNTRMLIIFSGEDKTAEEDFIDKIIMTGKFFGNTERTRVLAKEESDLKMSKELYKKLFGKKE